MGNVTEGCVDYLVQQVMLRWRVRVFVVPVVVVLVGSQKRVSQRCSEARTGRCVPRVQGAGRRLEAQEFRGKMSTAEM